TSGETDVAVPEVQQLAAEMGRIGIATSSDSPWLAPALEQRRPYMVPDTWAVPDEQQPGLVRRMAANLGISARDFWVQADLRTYVSVPVLSADGVLAVLDACRAEAS